MKRLRLGSYRSEPGESYGTPKEIWGFRTAPQAQPARRVVAEFLQANAALLELTADLGDLKYQKTLRSLAARHVILQQWYAVQDAIVPDFGQSVEAAAMGEGFGDYLAASFFADQKPPHYRTSVMTWDGLLLGLQEDRDPPCLRRVDLPRTYGDFEPHGAEHDNGTIWSATLWDVRELLGRERADRVILESHFQLDGFTRLARGARGILDANDNLYRGEDRPALMRLFARRKIKVT